MRTALEVIGLEDLGIVRMRGADAVKFLQGQLSNDVARLGAGRSILAGYHNPQGRAIALLQLVQWDVDDILAVVPRELASAVAARLAKFVLRAKVKIVDESAAWRVGGLISSAGGLGAPAVGADAIAVGLVSNADAATAAAASAGPMGVTPAAVAATAIAAAAIAAGDGASDVASGLAASDLPSASGAQARIGGAVFVCVGNQPARWLFVAPADGSAPLLAAPGGDRETWRQLDVAAGQPQVFTSTSEEFVAQMLNLDALEAIAFEKGCYTGQEVIARAHYRGRVKRRMQRFVSRDACKLSPGDAGQLPDGRAFKVVVAAQLADGRCDFLAVAPVTDPTTPPTVTPMMDPTLAPVAAAAVAPTVAAAAAVAAAIAPSTETAPPTVTSSAGGAAGSVGAAGSIGAVGSVGAARAATVGAVVDADAASLPYSLPD